MFLHSWQKRDGLSFGGKSGRFYFIFFIYLLFTIKRQENYRIHKVEVSLIFGAASERVFVNAYFVPRSRHRTQRDTRVPLCLCSSTRVWKGLFVPRASATTYWRCRPRCHRQQQQHGGHHAEQRNRVHTHLARTGAARPRPWTSTSPQPR